LSFVTSRRPTTASTCSYHRRRRPRPSRSGPRPRTRWPCTCPTSAPSRRTWPAIPPSACPLGPGTTASRLVCRCWRRPCKSRSCSAWRPPSSEPWRPPVPEWEMVIGLEVHCELRTATKLFCGCRNAFGDEPNTNICPVCLGLPGSLPVINERAVEFAMRIGEALHCTVQRSIFHRKNYFYPDMPKDYQISQYDLPINVRGWIELRSGGRIGITRAHMEEDTGKTTHVGGGGRIHEAAYALVDYNRAGVPLVEIVSDPDIRSAEEAH